MSRPVLHVITDTSSALKSWFQRLLVRPDSIVVKHVLRRVKDKNDSEGSVDSAF